MVEVGAKTTANGEERRAREGENFLGREIAGGTKNFARFAPCANTMYVGAVAAGRKEEGISGTASPAQPATYSSRVVKAGRHVLHYGRTGSRSVFRTIKWPFNHRLYVVRVV